MDQDWVSDEWSNAATLRRGPRYLAIVEALAAATANGAVAPGSRLPPQRALAEALGVDVTTVSRAMAEAQRQGLVVTRGRGGSFVAGPPRTAPGPDVVCDLSVNYPPRLDRELEQDVRGALAAAAGRADNTMLLDYPRAGWGGRHSVAGATWCGILGLQVSETRIALAGGAQQALLGITALLCEPGASIVAAGLTYPGMIAIARRMGVRVVGVDMDGEGVVPDSLALACARVNPRFIYLVPTFHNPTTATARMARRERLAAVIAASGAFLVEDDGHAALLEPHIPPIASLIPERSYYLSGLSKCLSPGLRTAYVAAPSAADADRLARTLISLGQFPAPIVAEAAADLVLSGTATAAAACMRRNASERWDIARRILPELQSGIAPTNHFGWLSVPPRWRGESFGERARSLGVGVASAGAFALAPRFVTSAVRVCLGSAPSLQQLAVALETLSTVLHDDPAVVRPLY